MKTPRSILVSLNLALTSVLILSSAFLASAQVTQTLYSTPTGTLRDNYSGAVGCQIKVGATNVVVSHVGVFGTSGGLAVSHIAGVMNTSLSVLGQVTVPAGTGAYFTNGFWWMPLDPPLLLAANGTYNVGGMVGSSDGDGWQDAFTPTTWNTFFIGSAATTTRHAMYGPGGSAVWPPASFSQNGNNNTYGNVSLSYIEVGQARVGVQTTSVSSSAGQTLSVTGFGTGQQPITYQWWLAPNTPLANQTNAILSIPNAGTNRSGTYFVTATNALGGEQSASVTVSITAFPVGITKNPTNITVFQNYPASFSMTATGTPPLYLQWSRNGSAIPGATSTNYTLAASAPTNNGDVYSCLASNYIAPNPYTATSSNATLTVLANYAQPQEFLHGQRSKATNNAAGTVGGQFTVGNTPVMVTHLGYFANGGTNLTLSHHVGIFSANGSVLYASTIVPAGNFPDATGTYVNTNGYDWAPLDAPFVLSANTQYLLVAEVFSGSPNPDPWGDTYSIPDLNPYFASACDATYWGAAWPSTGVAGGYSGQMYSAPNLAVLALPAPSAFASPASLSQYAGLDATFTATVAGQAPVIVQWYKEPGTLLSGQTNLILNLTNLSLGQSGNYYVVATNYMTGSNIQSADVSLTVMPDVGPSVTNDIQSQNVFEYQNLQFVVGVSGTPPMTYQWTFKGNPIAGATNNTLSLNNVSTANIGNYQLLITNGYGHASSSVAALGVIVPTWGTYSSAVMGSSLLAYYPLNDAATGTATNQGSLGLAYNGTYEGGYSGVAGPAGFSNFPLDNQAASFDGFSADVLVPSFGITVTNCTIAAWVMDGGGQPDNSTIFFERQSSVFGLAIGQNGAGEWLKYTWNNGSYNNNTGLILPTNQWAFVAMVINPTNAMIYLQNGTGMISTNFAGAYPSQSFTGNSYIGWDTQGGSTGRRWTGTVGPVMVFNQALSPVAINALYLGVPASATLTIAPAAGHNLTVTWPGGTLLEATNVTGPWTPTSGATNGVYTVMPLPALKFYKVQLQ
jgi:hypothetical protein